MKWAKAAVFLAALAVFAGRVNAEPDRDLGVGVTFFPKLSAAAPGGFAVTEVAGQRPEKGKLMFTTAAELLKFFQEQTFDVKLNGIWVIHTATASYSADKLVELESLQKDAVAQGVPLFLCPAEEFPAGWKQFGK